MLSTSFRHCLRHIADFRGRDSLSQYWPYVLALIVLQVLAGMLITLPMIVSGMMEAFAAIDAERISGHVTDPAMFQAQLMQSMTADMRATLPWTISIQIGFCLMVAAATVRRLHDRDWSGWWVLVGVAALAASIIGGQWTMAMFADDPISLIDNMGMVQAIGWAPWVGYAFLIVQLVQRGAPDANRFGEPPVG